MTGQVGQVNVYGGMSDGPGQGVAMSRPQNIFIGRQVNDDLSIKSDDSPYAVTFYTHTIQSTKRGVTIERGNAIKFVNPYFENLDQAMSVSVASLFRRSFR